MLEIAAVIPGEKFVQNAFLDLIAPRENRPTSIIGCLNELRNHQDIAEDVHPVLLGFFFFFFTFVFVVGSSLSVRCEFVRVGIKSFFFYSLRLVSRFYPKLY